MLFLEAVLARKSNMVEWRGQGPEHPSMENLIEVMGGEKWLKFLGIGIEFGETGIIMAGGYKLKCYTFRYKDNLAHVYLTNYYYLCSESIGFKSTADFNVIKSYIESELGVSLNPFDC